MTKKGNGLVICNLPKAGLGNQLFPLMKAYVFAYLNDLPILVSGYHMLKIGPYLRHEKSKRNYNDYFTFQKSIWKELFDKWKIVSLKPYPIVDEPFLEKIPNDAGKLVYRFSSVPHWDDLFKGLKDNRELVIKLFWDILRMEVKQHVDSFPSSIIGVHIRMRDFRKLASNEDFSKVGAVRTPENYFIDVITSIRKMYGSNLPVSVFTDGYKHEFLHLFKLQNIIFIEGNNDITDLLLLSKSKIIITSAGSTFGYWAGFLSNAALIMHPDHIYKSIRPLYLGKTIYEGPFDFNNEILKNNIRGIT